MKKTLEDEFKTDIFVSVDIITMKPKLETNKMLRFDENF